MAARRRTGTEAIAYPHPGPGDPPPPPVPPALRALAAKLRPLAARGPRWFGAGSYPLAIRIAGYGIERRTRDYDWNGLTRGKAEWVLLQYTFAGAGRLTWHGQHHQVLPGQLLVLPIPGDHRYFLPADGVWEFFYLCLSGREAMRAGQAAVQRAGPLLTLGANAPLIADATDVLTHILGEGHINPWMVSAMAYRLAMDLLATAIPAPQDAVASPALEAVVRWCQDHLAEDIGVERLAAIAGYSRYHFTRRFIQAYGLSPTAFVAETRIARATALLRQPGSTVQQVAKDCGFADPAYFCKVFRRVLGVSPGVFRDSGMY
jgi:AraC-like DNA-binding protein